MHDVGANEKPSDQLYLVGGDLFVPDIGGLAAGDKHVVSNY